MTKAGDELLNPATGLRTVFQNTKMVRVTIEVREDALTYRVRIIAPSIECALEIAGAGKAGRRVRLLFPIDPEAYFVSAGSGTREAA
jgi:hypothetical protein